MGRAVRAYAVVDEAVTAAAKPLVDAPMGAASANCSSLKQGRYSWGRHWYGDWTPSRYRRLPSPLAYKKRFSAANRDGPQPAASQRRGCVDRDRSKSSMIIIANQGWKARWPHS